MRILWIVNTIFPYPAKQIGQKENCFGGWLNGLADNLKENKEIKLAIATVYKGNEIKKFDDGMVIYYLIPGAPAIKYNHKLEKYWKEVSNDFKPELVHIHGTEYAHGLAFKNACPDIKTIVAIQGLVSNISKVYYANLDTWTILKNLTFRDIIRNDSIFQQRKKMAQRGKNEIKLIKLADAIIGRTTWDYANTKAINPNEKYFFCNETLRAGFYNKEWNIDNVERYSIFTTQASYPIKGLHGLLKTIYILKQKYPNVKLYIAGSNILDKSTMIKKIKFSGYAKILTKLIKKYDINDNVEFVGLLNEEQIIERYLKSHVFVLASVIENESNALSEAAILGMPSVASYVGGIPDRVENNKNGFLYPYTESAMCAEYISRYFEDDDLCKKYGQEARKQALKRHDPKNNKEDMIKIYKEMIGGLY